MEFKVGQKYKVLDGVSEAGNIIEITNVKKDEIFNTDYISYKTIKGNKGISGGNNFDNKSTFSKCLELIADKKECIVIYRKGNETIALDRSTGEKAVAKCSPEDTYDFNTGAKLAFERLIGEKEPMHVNCKCSLVTEVRRKAKIGEYIKVTNEYFSFGDYVKGDIIEVTEYKQGGVVGINTRTQEETVYLDTDEYVVLENYKPEEKPEFKPYLVNKKGTRYGNIGEVTPFKDAIGREIRVGDTVDLYNEDNILRGERVAVKKDGHYFINGIAADCHKDGSIYGVCKWKIILKRKHEDIANGEAVDGIKYIKEEV